MNKKSLGFTLAEVLIALAVVGVVAVITTGVLINHLGNPYIKNARLRYNDFVKAYRSIESQFGPIENWSIARDGWTAGAVASDGFVAKYFAPKLHATKICLQGDNTCTAYNMPQPYGISFLTDNGSTWNFMTYNSGFYVIEFDTNGATGPNKIGVDKFFFGMNNHGLDGYATSPFKNVQGIVIPGDELTNPGCRKVAYDSFAHWNLVINGGSVPSDCCLQVLIHNNWDASKYPIKDFS